MIKRILRIAKYLDIRRNTYSSKKTDAIEIVIRIPISEAAGLNPYYPKGSITAYTICFGKGEPFDPDMKSRHMIGDVTDKFDLKAYLREWEEAAKAEANDAMKRMAIREGAHVRIAGGQFAGYTGVVLQTNRMWAKIRLDERDREVDVLASVVELID